jgi:hypothetical protein
VFDNIGSKITFAVVDGNSPYEAPFNSDAHPFIVDFKVELPPLGFSTYFLEISPQEGLLDLKTEIHPVLSQAQVESTLLFTMKLLWSSRSKLSVLLFLTFSLFHCPVRLLSNYFDVLCW